MSATVILVHGAMHTPWIFGPVQNRLTEAAIASVAVQLPSSNPNPAVCGGLVEDAETVRRAIRAVDGPVVIVAHSYGGVPASWAAAAEPSHVSGIVYLAAFVLDAGTSMMQWMGGAFPLNWTRSPDRLAVKAGDPEQSIFSGVDPILTEEAVSRLNWQGIRAFTDELAQTPPRGLHSSYIVATEDQALPPEVQRAWADAASERFDLPSGHSPHLSHPDEVARIIVNQAQTTSR